MQGDSCSEVVSRTLNYYQSDFAIAQAALGSFSRARNCMHIILNILILIALHTCIHTYIHTYTALGKTSDAEILSARAMNYSLIFDKKSGFFRSRVMVGVHTYITLAIALLF